MLPLAACGGSKKSTSQTNLSPSAAVREAATKTAAKGSEHVGLNGTAVLSGQQVTVTGNGDFKGHAGTLHLDFNAGGLAGTIDAVVEGTKLYMRSPLLLSSLKAGKTWLEIDIAKAANAGGALALSKLAAQDPAQTLAAARRAEERVEGRLRAGRRGRDDALPGEADRFGDAARRYVRPVDRRQRRLRSSRESLLTSQCDRDARCDDRPLRLREER